MKVIIKNETGAEEVFYEPDPIQEKPLNQSIIKSIIEDIIFIPLILIGVFGLLIGILTGILALGAFLKFILNDTTMAIIAFVIIILLSFLYLFNYSPSVTFMLIDKKTQSIIIDYEFMNKMKNKREILEFINIKDIKFNDVIDEYGTIIEDKYGNLLTNLILVKKEKNWLGLNECLYLDLNVPREKVVEFARAVGIDLGPIDTTLQMREV